MSNFITSKLQRLWRGQTSDANFRQQGDEARDRKDWTAAAQAYRTHLQTTPRDFPIHVQLGHALKEAGHIELALAAYRDALAIKPDDADLLVNMGHAHKLAGDMDIAIGFYQRSAAIGDNLSAADELVGLNAPDARPRDPVDPTTLESLINVLAPRCAGVTLVAATDVTARDSSKIRLYHPDPWLDFKIDIDLASSSVALLTLEAAHDQARSLASQIYLNVGEGYNEQHSVKFSPINGMAHILIAYPGQIKKIRWDPDFRDNIIVLPGLSIRPVRSIADLADLEQHGSVLASSQTMDIVRLLLDEAEDAISETSLAPVLIPLGDAVAKGADNFAHNYDIWQLVNAKVSDADYRAIERMTADMPYRPTFSFIMPTYNTPAKLLSESIESMLTQTYPDFEICIADDNSKDPEVAKTIALYCKRDPRVKFHRRARNGHISAASNSALALATGGYVVLMDHDDLIPDYALFVVAWYLNQNPFADILFSDEDKITMSRRHLNPYFKGIFNKYLMYGHNMVSHLGIYRRSLVEEVGGFRLGLEGSQDYDLFLRCYERSADERVVHIPHVLYHWRQVAGSTAISADQKSYALLAAQHAINGHFERTGVPLRSIIGKTPGNTSVLPSRSFDTSTSIIIPTRNGLDLLRPCLSSIRDAPTDSCEIIVVDNGSDDPEALDYLQYLERERIARVLRYPGEFNYSLINNFAAAHASGEILCFLNNDTELQSPNWIDRARAFLSMDEIGAVGAKLLYPDGALQHFGIGIGMSEHRVAGLPHAGAPAGYPGYFSKANLIQEVSAVTAACLFIRATTFFEIGGFEPDLRVAYNDVDLCLKVRKKGLRILVDPEIVLIHKESRSRGSDRDGQNAKRLDREAAWMHAKWGATLTQDPYLSPNIDLMRGDFAYDFAPRTPFPWKQGSITTKR